MKRKQKKALWTQTPKGQAQITQAARDKVAKRIERQKARRILAQSRKIQPSAKFAVRKRLRARSPAYARKMAAYRKRRDEWLIEKVCAKYRMEPATEVHHQRGRAGKLLMDERFWIPVSARAHRLIHDFPESARRQFAFLQDGRELMLMCAKGDWNRQP